MRKCTCLALVACCTALISTAAIADSAADYFKQGNTLLESGDFDGAYKMFRKATQADKENAEYKEQATILRQVLKMRKHLDREKNSKKWEETALALRSFYHGANLLNESLILDQKAFGKLNTGKWAWRVAETHLTMGNNSEAEAFLAGLDAKLRIPHTDALFSISLSRQGKLDEARKVAESCSIPKDAKAGLLFDAACMQALIGESSKACDLLSRCFEQTPPSRLEGGKLYAAQCPDLASLKGTPAFTEAMKTASKIKESSCSGGSNCGSCPSKASCTKSKKKD